jgi:protein O-GlcNAc transferase
VSVDIAKASFVEGTDHLEKGDFAEAEQCFIRTLTYAPRSVPTLSNLALVQFKQRKFSHCIATAKSLIEIDENNFGAYEFLSSCQNELGDYQNALYFCDKSLEIDPTVAEAHCNRASCLNSLNRFEEAIESCNRALSIAPLFAHAILNRGNARKGLKRHEEAFADYDKTLSIKPDLAEAWLGRGNVFYDLKRYDEALSDYDKALSIKPDLAEAWLGRGNVFDSLTRYDEASAAYDKALSFKRDLPGAWKGRGAVSIRLKRYDEAIAAYDRALQLKPDLNYVEGDRIYAKLLSCNWTNLKPECDHLVAGIAANKLAAHPFHLALVPSSAADRLKCAKMYCESEFPSRTQFWRGERYGHDRIRVAYLSSDYRNHPISYAIAELFHLHDRKKFEVVGVSFGLDDKSEIRSKVMNSLDQFHDVQSMTDAGIAELIKRLEIDIAVDLNNYTDFSRSGILARRPAPIQVSHLGYPGTMGNDWIDYAIVDKFVLPAGQEKYWTERLVYMPESYHPHDTITKRNMPTQIPTRIQVGLPERAFVLCCFNNYSKLTPAAFQVWMRLLMAIDHGVLWLSSANETICTHLRNAAATAGVDPARLIFASKLERMEDHLSRHRAADLFLDTFVYNAHTTAADALWAGLPVVTCSGETFPARVAGSFLRAIGLQELITESEEGYEALVLSLARNPGRLREIKAKLASNRDTYPLFDMGRFTRHLESAYLTMWERQQKGEMPQAFAVTPN